MKTPILLLLIFSLPIAVYSQTSYSISGTVGTTTQGFQYTDVSNPNIQCNGTNSYQGGKVRLFAKIQNGVLYLILMRHNGYNFLQSGFVNFRASVCDSYYNNYNSSQVNFSSGTNQISWSMPLSNFNSGSRQITAAIQQNGTLNNSWYYTETITITATSSAPSISNVNVINAPLTAGQNIDVTWNDNIPENVRIDIYKGSTLKGYVSSTSSDGSSSLTTSSLNLPQGNDYKIKVSSVSNPSLSAWSSNFSVQTLSNISISQPSWSSSYERGSSLDIKFTTTSTGSHDIFYKKGYGSKILIGTKQVSSTSGTQTHTWSIPNSLSLGSNYKIQIENGTVSEQSNNFSITSGPTLVGAVDKSNGIINFTDFNFEANLDNYTGSSSNVNMKILYCPPYISANGPGYLGTCSGNFDIEETMYWSNGKFRINNRKLHSLGTYKIKFEATVGNKTYYSNEYTILVKSPVPDEILSPVSGGGIDQSDYCVSQPSSTASQPWSFWQRATCTGPGHNETGGINDADDTYAWDCNKNYPQQYDDSGKPVHAVADGHIMIGADGFSSWQGGSSGQILIKHQNADGSVWYSGYLHLSNITSKKCACSWATRTVSSGDVIGYISDVGANNKHLHFAVYYLDKDNKLRSVNTTIVGFYGTVENN